MAKENMGIETEGWVNETIKRARLASGLEYGIKDGIGEAEEELKKLSQGDLEDIDVKCGIKTQKAIISQLESRLEEGEK